MSCVLSGNWSAELRQAGGGGEEPSLAAETYRRAVENDVVEMWYYLRSQLTQLRHQLEAGSSGVLKKAAAAAAAATGGGGGDGSVDQFSVQSMLTRLSDVIDTGLDYKRFVLLCDFLVHFSYDFINNSDRSHEWMRMQSDIWPENRVGLFSQDVVKGNLTCVFVLCCIKFFLIDECVLCCVRFIISTPSQDIGLENVSKMTCFVSSGT